MKKLHGRTRQCIGSSRSCLLPRGVTGQLRISLIANDAEIGFMRAGRVQSSVDRLVASCRTLRQMKAGLPKPCTCESRERRLAKTEKRHDSPNCTKISKSQFPQKRLAQNNKREGSSHVHFQAR